MALEKAKIYDINGKELFTVLFNPEQYTLDRKNSFAQITVHGLSSPLLQFSHGELKTLQMELFFDSREKHTFGTVTRTQVNSDVRDVVDQFLNLMNIDSELHAPPVLIFSWGSLKFQCVLASASQQYTMFHERGYPLRAKLNVTFQEYTNRELEARQVNRHTPDYTKTHEVNEGDTLAGIAFVAYGDAGLWRPIALRNGLDDPRRLPVGGKLVIPRLPFRAAGSDQIFG
ncbi:CIS tube protein [Zavarzinella formosa]|uniref:CIS tube protein n=1 Tax=Zavarzinella formosa TaxID=360055 RepID=UPI0003181346|nr:LysM peptidoglycan-binding domain-containing protein [Zavarzinella formosa]